MPDFVSCETDRRRETKYVVRAAIERRNRAAIRTGKKLYDASPEE